MKENVYQQIGAVILAGGRNRRMHGEKKAFFRFEEKSFLEHLKDGLAGFEAVYLSVDTPGSYEQAGLPLVVDLYPGVGPIGGICSALEKSSETALFVAACDMPYLQRKTVERILTAYREHPGTVTIAEADGRRHTLFGVYPRCVLPQMKQQIAEGKYKMIDLLNITGYQTVQLEEGDRSVVNINSVREYLEQAGDSPVDIETAVCLLRGSIDTVTETEIVPLSGALGRVLAEDVTADMDQPPFPRSPLDGYALRAADSQGTCRDLPVTLQVIGKIYAGQVFDGKVGPGECVRLMTGAPIPEGADAVIRQEDTDYGEEQVQIYTEHKAFENYCEAGDDFRCGDVLLSAGTRVSSIAAAVAAGTGRDSLTVFREPKIAVVSTGDEIVPAGEMLTPGKIYDTNLTFVVSRLNELGLKNVTGQHSMDDTAGMAERIRELAKNNDLIVTTGGVSVGEKDIMHGVLEELHAEKLFWRVRLKPGSPTLAFMFENKLVICLTGNPYGVMVNFELLVRPVLEKLTGGSVSCGRKGRRKLGTDSPKRGKMRRFLKGFADEETAFFSEGSQASGTISGMAECNCYIELPAGSGGKKGDIVWVHYL